MYGLFESVYFSDKLLTDLNSLVERHWVINESIQDDDLSSSLQEDKALGQLKQGYKVCEGNRVQLPCLWRNGTSMIRSNFDYARQRLRSLLQSKLLRDGSILLLMMRSSVNGNQKILFVAYMYLIHGTMDTTGHIFQFVDLAGRQQRYGQFLMELQRYRGIVLMITF